MTRVVESNRFPYVPITFSVAGVRHEAEALLDAGFDGDVVVPSGIAATFGARRRRVLRWALADGSVVRVPAPYGFVSVGGLPSFPVSVIALGTEVIVGRGVATRYRILLEHGRRVTLEP